MSLSIGHVYEAKIQKLTFNGGRGLTRIEGFVVFVPLVLPGEIVKIKIIKTKKSYAEAELVEILTAHADRVTPRCEYFGRCGGCSWQHIPYKLQARYKEEILIDLLNKLSQKVELNEFFPAKNEFNYRNRIQIQTKNSRSFFKKRASSELVEIKSCDIADKAINAHLMSGSKNWSQKKLQRIEIALGQDEKTHEVKRGFKNSVRLFSQVNNEQNKVLIQKVLKFFKDINPSKILDLYCGNGNFSFPLAMQHPNLTIEGVEMSQPSVSSANELNRTDNLKFTCSSVENYLENCEITESTAILIDPPRTGLDPRASNELFRSKTQNIIYISCNPMTFIRDVNIAIEHGFEVKYVAGLDMFPQTDHIEVIAQLLRP